MTCKFVAQMGKLRKLSAESVENVGTFDLFKEYLHIERPVETELKAVLREVRKRQSKCLVLVCGSAGDGKSHLISYLKNADRENLLEGFELYNDATESSEPTLTSIDTLADRLSAFNDAQYMINNAKKMIVAINLGTLNNFIQSDKGKQFSSLRKYVESCGILSGISQAARYKENSVFQHVSFSDYQVFSLGPNGIETDYLKKLLGKIFEKTENNPFYASYCNDCSCANCQRCPVRHNYEFLSNTVHQKEFNRANTNRCDNVRFLLFKCRRKSCS